MVTYHDTRLSAILCMAVRSWETALLTCNTDWSKEDELGTAGSGAGTTHLWEESWDDDDTSDEFSQQLKEELKKMGHGK